MGGGPAGAAAAITATSAGLRVLVVERQAFPRSAVGETLHPGAEPLLDQLGAGDAVRAAGFLRHPGHFVRWGGPEHFVPFSADAPGASSWTDDARKYHRSPVGGDKAWLGFQAWRPEFDTIMLNRARAVGAAVMQPCRVLRPIVEAGRVAGVETDRESFRSEFVIDATGRRSWLARHLRVDFDLRGRRMVWFGYAAGRCAARDVAPALEADAGGWTWVARVRPDLYQWTRWAGDNRRPADDWLPDVLRGLAPLAPPQGADVTWRVARAPAGPGYFLVGDAAAVLDPASSHGVLKALMSGMMAGHIAAQVLAGRSPEAVAAEAYGGWIHAWFDRDVRELRAFYDMIPWRTGDGPS